MSFSFNNSSHFEGGADENLAQKRDILNAGKWTPRFSPSTQEPPRWLLLGYSVIPVKLSALPNVFISVALLLSFPQHLVSRVCVCVWISQKSSGWVQSRQTGDDRVRERGLKRLSVPVHQTHRERAKTSVLLWIMYQPEKLTGNKSVTAQMLRLLFVATTERQISDVGIFFRTFLFFINFSVRWRCGKTSQSVAAVMSHNFYFL